MTCEANATKLRFLIAAVLALVVALTIGVGSAKAQTCALGYEYAGYELESVLGVGSTYSVDVAASTDTFFNTGHIAGWAGATQYDSNGNPISWLQAGVLHLDGGALEQYIEYRPLNGNATIVYSAAASYMTAYPVSIYRVGSTSWKATVNGHSYTATVNANDNEVTGEAWNGTTTCNDYSYEFSLSSVAVSNMYPNVDAPYYNYVESPGRWFSGDLQPDCQPKCQQPPP